MKRMIVLIISLVLICASAHAAPHYDWTRFTTEQLIEMRDGINTQLDARNNTSSTPAPPSASPTSTPTPTASISGDNDRTSEIGTVVYKSDNYSFRWLGFEADSDTVQNKMLFTNGTDQTVYLQITAIAYNGIQFGMANAVEWPVAPGVSYLTSSNFIWLVQTADLKSVGLTVDTITDVFIKFQIQDSNDLIPNILFADSFKVSLSADGSDVRPQATTTAQASSPIPSSTPSPISAVIPMGRWHIGVQIPEGSYTFYAADNKRSKCKIYANDSIGYYSWSEIINEGSPVYNINLKSGQVLQVEYAPVRLEVYTPIVFSFSSSQDNASVTVDVATVNIPESQVLTGQDDTISSDNPYVFYDKDGIKVLLIEAKVTGNERATYIDLQYRVQNQTAAMVCFQPNHFYINGVQAYKHFLCFVSAGDYNTKSQRLVIQKAYSGKELQIQFNLHVYNSPLKNGEKVQFHITDTLKLK